MDEKFKNTVEKFQDILDYYVQNEIFSKKCGSKWNVYNKFFINTSILKKCFNTDNPYEIWKQFIGGKIQFLSLMFLLKDDNTHYPLTVNEVLQLITSSQYTFDDFHPTITIGYLSGKTSNLFSTDEADYICDTFISLENSKKKTIFEYSNFPWKSSRLIRNLIYMIEKKIKELNELYPD